MALITIFSAKSSPGVTTTAMLVASLWPRPAILVDADPQGGDIALRLPTAEGRAMSRDRGLLSLLPVARRGLVPGMVEQHTQLALGGQPVVAGLAGPDQAEAVGPLWATLADAFGALPDADVVVDAGHLGSRSAHRALLDRADVAVCVYRPSVTGVVHTRYRLEGLADSLSHSGTRMGLVAVAGERQGTDVQGASAAIRRDWTWLHDFGSVAHDPRAVLMFEGHDVARPERSLLARSGRRLADVLFEGSGSRVGGHDASAEPQSEPQSQHQSPPQVGEGAAARADVAQAAAAVATAAAAVAADHSRDGAAEANGPDDGDGQPGSRAGRRAARRRLLGRRDR